MGGEHSTKLIESCAEKMLTRHGEDAESEALMRADSARMYHNRTEVTLWLRVADAIRRLKAEPPS